jgi:GH15 family glucan-1,4-alpha-glucosidase
VPAEEDAWNLRLAMLEFLETCWNKPDEGIWEVRGPARQFTHSKVMAWVAFDRAVRGLDSRGDGVDRARLERWRALRARMHREICAHGYNSDLGAFVQEYGGKALDASLLMMPLVGFLPPTDARVLGTVQAIEARLLEGGFVRRYESDPRVDGLPAGEGVFLPCSFWLADNWALMGRTSDASALFERLVALCNDVGLLSEEYDVSRRRLLGNFPQAFSHVSLINSARTLTDHASPARRRSGAQ